MNDSTNSGTTYAPRSPDLSFLAQDVDKSNESPYHPRSPRIQDAIIPQTRPNNNYYTTPYNNNSTAGYEPQYPPIPPLPNTHNQFGGGGYHQAPIHSHANQPTSQYQVSPPSYNQSPPAYNRSLPYQQTPSNPINIKHQHPNTQPYQPNTNNAYPTPDNSFPGYASNTGKTMAQSASSSSSRGLGPSQGIEVKTKFPVARIKRIMQADEEVGKVAQVTPVAVSKALELFMISLCTKSAEIARTGNSKRITASHLKSAIEKDEQYDFLTDIVSKVADQPEAGGGDGGEKKGRGRAKVEKTSDSDEVEKKVKSTRGRKKKVEG